MCDLWHDLSVGQPVGCKLIGDNHPWHLTQSFEQLSKKALCRFRVSPFLDQDVQDFDFLVNGSPQVNCWPLILRNASSSCHVSPQRPWRRLSLRAYSVPNVNVQSRIVSCDTSTHRSIIISCTSRKLRQKRKYNHVQ